MKQIHFVRSFVMLMALALLVAAPVRAGDLDDDITTTKKFGPVTWEPVITEMFVKNAAGESYVVDKPAAIVTRNTDVLGEQNQWANLKQLIAFRGDPEKGIPEYPAEESVISAWHRQVDEKGKVSYVVYGSG